MSKRKAGCWKEHEGISQDLSQQEPAILAAVSTSSLELGRGVSRLRSWSHKPRKALALDIFFSTELAHQQAGGEIVGWPEASHNGAHAGEEKRPSQVGDSFLLPYPANARVAR
jgi:hypothetical protein